MTTDVFLVTVVAGGLVFSILGSWLVMRSTPIIGGNPDYLTVDRTGPIEALIARQRWGWRLLLLGFVLQFIGTMGFVVAPFL